VPFRPFWLAVSRVHHKQAWDTHTWEKVAVLQSVEHAVARRMNLLPAYPRLCLVAVAFLGGWVQTLVEMELSDD
jgi:hypothetical protein